MSTGGWGGGAWGGGAWGTGAAAGSATSLARGKQTGNILLQAIIDPIGRHADGDLVVALQPAWGAIVDAMQKDPQLLFQIGARQFEELIAGAYDEAGYDEVILTPRSGDLGRDIIATKKGYMNIRILDQAKRYKVDHLVTAEEVRAMYGTLSIDQRASKGLVTTTSDFAPGCVSEFASLIPTRMELVNGIELQRRLSAIAAGKIKV